MNRLILCFLAFLLCTASGKGQVLPDSLKIMIAKASYDTSKFRLLEKTAMSLIIKSDTAKRELFIKSSLNIAEKQNRAIEFAEFLAQAFEKTGDYSQAIDYYNLESKYAERSDNKRTIAYVFKQLGNVYYNLGNFGKAIENHFKCLKTSEQSRDSAGMAASYNNIGNVYSWQQDFAKAQEYYSKSLAIEERRKNPIGIASSLNNLGFVFENQLDYDTALIFYRKSLQISQSSDNQSYIALAYNNIANVFNKTGMDSALYYYQSAFSLYEKLGEKRSIADIYLSIGKYYKENLDYKKAENYFINAYKLSFELKSQEIYMNAALGLSDVYAKMGNFKYAYEYHILYKRAESIVKDDKTMKIINQGAMKYQLDIKTAEQAAEKKRQVIVTAFFLFALTFMIILAIVIYSSYRRKRRDNILLSQQKEEIETQRDQIEVQRDQVTHQRDQIQRQKEEITDSIHYASRIQTAILPPEDYRKSILPEHFVLNKPRDIVSGDFYWMTMKDGKVVALAADCTGHGVPGAFMSMLGVSFLNEIVIKNNILEPSQILNLLRENIIRALHQTGKAGENKDGMDISLSVIDRENGTVRYAGAYNPLYILRGDEVLELKADRMPIGIYQEKNDLFTSQTVSLQKNDTLYMLSDGYIDQFGGPEGKKLKAKAFKELLLTLRNLPMDEQKNRLEEFNREWMEGYPQVDDILVMGIRI